MLRGQQYGFRTDVWGLGVLAYFLFAGKFPFTGRNDIELIRNIKYSEPDWMIFTDRDISIKIVKLIKNMLAKNSLKRFTMEKVIKSEVLVRIRELDSRGSFKFNKLNTHL